MWDGIVRVGRPEDLPFLQKMLYEAVFWDPGWPRLPLEEVLAQPELKKVFEGWGRPGDTALLALADPGVPAGAAWYRFWTADNQTYGFVDTDTPSLGLAVEGAMRGQGIGTRLLEEALAHACARGVERMSLSVWPENPSRRLYERVGFKKVAEEGRAWTMVADVRHL